MKKKLVTTRDLGQYYIGGKFVDGTSASDRKKQKKVAERATQRYAKAKVKHR